MLLQVFKQGDRCADEVSIENKVKVTVDTGMSDLTCFGFTDGEASSGFIKLSATGEREISCKQVLPTDRTDKIMITTINVTYDYKQSVSKNLLVKHSE